MPSRRLAVTLLAAAALAPCAVAGAAPTVTEFPAGPSIGGAHDIVAGPDGALWFTLTADDGIGRITAAGAITEYAGGDAPRGIVAGPGRTLWYTQSAAARIGRITVDGSGVPSFTEFSAGITPGSAPTDIALGPDGNLWFTQSADPGGIARIAPDGTVTQFSAGLTPNRSPWQIAAGPDGALWFTEKVSAGRIGRITTAGVITEHLLPDAEQKPIGIAAGPDGNLWITQEKVPAAIARVTPLGLATDFAGGLTGASLPSGIAVGGDGNLWFAQEDAGIGRITPAGTVTEYGGVTPGSKPRGVTQGPDGNVWFTQSASPGRIGRITVGPHVADAAASEVGLDAATFTAYVTPNSQHTLAHVEYGPTTAYGATTNVRSVGSQSSRELFKVKLGGLAAGTEYHARVVAANATETVAGPDVVFRTASPPSPPVTPPAPPAPPAVPGPGPAAPPALGRSVAVRPASGEVRVRVPGAPAFVALGAAASLPVGSVVDARAGRVRLTSALPAGRAQTGTFWGGVFQVRQSPAGRGMTDLHLRGQLRACPRPGTAAALARRRPPRLWGKDDGGRFRTHGNNSVATVRGTRWLTVDSCAGTLTRVAEGSVVVRDLRRGRTVVVRAGQRYLAAPRP